MTSASPTTALQRPSTTERMPIPPSVWVVGGLMALLLSGLVAALTATAPDPMPLRDLRVLQSTMLRQSGLSPARSMPLASSFLVDRSGGLPALGAESADPVAECTGCGVVESVRAIQRKLEAPVDIHLVGDVPADPAPGTSAQQVRSEVVYRIRVRMDDGSLRTLTQRRAPTVGARVVVAGRTLRPTPLGA